MTLEIKRMLARGELGLSETPDREELIEACGRLLDKCCVYEAIGDVVFEGADGKFYKVFVEALIEEIDPCDAEDYDENART
jgi:hypothetical protein